MTLPISLIATNVSVGGAKKSESFFRVLFKIFQ
jgi:hypothetical protein